MTFLTLTDALNYHKRKYEAVKKLETIVAEKGYKMIEPAYLEHYDRFTKMHRRIRKESMVKLIDTEGAVRILRPDVTTSIIKELIPKWEAGVRLKLFYNASVFLNTDQGISEQKQFGVEHLGDASLQSDLEMTTLILRIFSVFKLDFILEISHAGFLSGLFSDLHLDEEKLESLKKIIFHKNTFELTRFIENNPETGPYRGLLTQLFSLQGDLETIKSKLTGIDVPAKANAALEILEEIDSMTDTDNTTFDLGMIGQFDYYDGVLFKGYLANTPTAILSGGRYNTQTMGYEKAVPATGFSFALQDLLKEVMD